MILNETFTKQRQLDASTKSRESHMRTIEEAIAKYYEIHGKLSSGDNFFTNLLIKLSNLNRSCEDISYSQQLQRQDYEQSFVQQREREIQVY